MVISDAGISIWAANCPGIVIKLIVDGLLHVASSTVAGYPPQSHPASKDNV